MHGRVGHGAWNCSGKSGTGAGSEVSSGNSGTGAGSEVAPRQQHPNTTTRTKQQHQRKYSKQRKQQHCRHASIHTLVFMTARTTPRPLDASTAQPRARRLDRPTTHSRVFVHGPALQTVNAPTAQHLSRVPGLRVASSVSPGAKNDLDSPTDAVHADAAKDHHRGTPCPRARDLEPKWLRHITILSLYRHTPKTPRL